MDVYEIVRCDLSEAGLTRARIYAHAMGPDLGTTWWRLVVENENNKTPEMPEFDALMTAWLGWLRETGRASFRTVDERGYPVMVRYVPEMHDAVFELLKPTLAYDPGFTVDACEVDVPSRSLRLAGCCRTGGVEELARFRGAVMSAFV